VSFYPLVQQRRFYALGAWTQHLLFCGVHLGGSAALAAVAARCPSRFRLLVWPFAVVCGGLSSLAIYYHWTAAKDVAAKVL